MHRGLIKFNSSTSISGWSFNSPASPNKQKGGSQGGLTVSVVMEQVGKMTRWMRDNVKPAPSTWRFRSRSTSSMPRVPDTRCHIKLEEGGRCFTPWEGVEHGNCVQSAYGELFRRDYFVFVYSNSESRSTSSVSGSAIVDP